MEGTWDPLKKSSNLSFFRFAPEFLSDFDKFLFKKHQPPTMEFWLVFGRFWRKHFWPNTIHWVKNTGQTFERCPTKGGGRCHRGLVGHGGGGNASKADRHFHCHQLESQDTTSQGEYCALKHDDNGLGMFLIVGCPDCGRRPAKTSSRQASSRFKIP